MKISKGLKKLLVALLTGALASVLISSLSMFPPLTGSFERLENLLYDISFQYRYHQKMTAFEKDTTLRAQAGSITHQENRILLIDIDEQSMQKLGNYNLWPRTHHAKVVENLSKGGASLIAFDILFKNASWGKNYKDRALTALKTLPLDTNWEKYESELQNAFNYDSVLVEEVRRAKNVIVAATVGGTSEYTYPRDWEPLADGARQKSINPSSTINDKILEGVSHHVILDNIFPELANAADKVGLVNVIADADGVHRKEPAFHAFPHPEYLKLQNITDVKPSYYSILSLQAAMTLMGIEPNEIEVKRGEYIRLGQPFGVYRDSSGTLTTTFPNLTYPMIVNLLKKKKKISEIAKGKHGTLVEDIAPPVVVYHEIDSTFSAEIFDATTVTPRLLNYILNTKDFIEKYKSTKAMGNSTPKENLGEDADESEEPIFKSNLGFSFYWDSEENLVYLIDSEDEDEDEIYLDDYTVDLLRSNSSKFHSIPLGGVLHLSCELNVSLHPLERKLRSNFIILSPDVLKSIIKADVKDFEALKPGEIKRFGPDIKIPIDDNYRIQINYTGRYEAATPDDRPYEQISYLEVIKANRDNWNAYQGKITILGSAAAALFDQSATPLDKVYPSVMIHATILENILKNDFIRLLENSYQIWILLLISLFAVLIANYLPPLFSIPSLLVVASSFFLINDYYLDQGLYLGLTKPGLTLVLSFILVMAIRYFFEEREKRFINSAFKEYISPELIDQMVDAETKPQLGGSEGFLTAYFTDIASFSTFSEKIGSPTKLVELLNEYLSAMTDILTGNQGTLDKYEGDAIIAFFGAPMPLENHAEVALRTALGMQDKLKELRAVWESQGDKWPQIVHAMRMRIGINSGNIVTGNMGSKLRKNYTMMGDAVNLAARLESGAKLYGVFTMCSKETLLETGDIFLSRAIDSVRVVGRSEAVETFEVLAVKSEASDTLIQLVELFDLAKKLYIEMKWDLAIEAFENCMEFEPHHPDREPGCKTTPSHLLIERCNDYKQNPPVSEGEIWDGVYTATEK